jgi:hypothetical protein
MRQSPRRPEVKVGASSTPIAAEAPPVRPLRGIVKEGRINLLEGSIPEGTIVVVMPEKALGQRAQKS